MSGAKVYDPKQVTLTIDGERFEPCREIVRRPAGSLGVGAYDDGPVGFYEIMERPTERTVLPVKAAQDALIDALVPEMGRRWAEIAVLGEPVERTSPGEPLDPLPPAAPRCPACGRSDCPTLRRADGADLDACAARVVRTDGGKP